MIKRIAYAVVLLWVLGSSPEAHAQLDSLAAAATQARPRYDFNNSYTGSIKGNVASITMSNQLGATMLMRNGWTASTLIRINETAFRLQDREDSSRNLSLNLMMPFAAGFTLSARIADNRFFNRLITFSNAIQDFKNDSKNASATVAWTGTLPQGVALSSGSTVSVSKSEQTFLEDSGRRGSVYGQVSYNVGSRIKVRGRGFLNKSDDTATTSGVKNDGLGVDEDSLVTRIEITLTDKTSATVDYSQATRTNEFMDLPRGVFQEVQFKDNLTREVATRTLDDLTLTATTYPLAALKLDVVGQHNEAVSDFLVAKTRFSRRVTDLLRGNFTYTFKPGTVFNVKLENRERLNDLGPQSLGSFTDKQRSARFSLTHRFNKTFDMNFQTGTAIVQAFYLDFEFNPRDRDQLDQYVNLKLNSSPFPKTKAAVYLAVNQTDFVNIDGSLSRNNRRETTYNFRPELTYTLNPRIEIRQTYGLNLELTEFDFAEDDNFLDRNFTFTNTVRAQLTGALTTELYYQLLLHDRGSYLFPPEGGERLLNINQEDRRDQMSVSFRYTINPHLTLLGKNDYSQRRDEFGAGRSAIFTNGGLEIGIEGAYDWGEARTLSLKLRKVNRFGRFNSKEQEDFWIMDSSVRYAF